MNAQQRWEHFLETVKETSRPVYQKRVEEYHNWCSEFDHRAFEAESLLTYMKHLHDEGIFMTSTLWSLVSIIGTYMECYNGKKPAAELPLIHQLLKNWQKTEDTKKAETFSKEEVFKFLNEAPDDDNYLVKKVVMIIAINCCQRKCEIAAMNFEDLKFNPDCILVEMYRAKDRGKKCLKSSAITDGRMREIVSLYISKFPESERKGRLFRKMKNGKVTKQVIGENKIAEYGKDIALYLGHPEEVAAKFTSHCFRRTAGTILAEENFSMDMIKIAGNWKSTTAAQGYIDNSIRMKRRIGDAFGTEESENLTVSKTPKNQEPSGTTSIATQNVYNYTISNVQNCQFHFFLPEIPKVVEPVKSKNAELSPLRLKLTRTVT